MMSKLLRVMLVLVSTFIISSQVEGACCDRKFGERLGGRIYLGTITDPLTGAFLSRVIVTLNADGTLLISDSRQQGDEPFPPFGVQHGYWEKDRGALEIRTIDFNYPKFFTVDWPTGNPGPQSLVVLNGELHKDHLLGVYAGPVFLSFFPITADINNPSQGSAPVLAGNLVLDTRIRRP